MGSTAANPAATPLLVPINPPNTMADLGLSKPIRLANKGVIVITKIDLTRPAAMLKAITSLLAPIAEPLMGPTTKVTVPAPIVVISLGSLYPKAIATMDRLTSLNVAYNQIGTQGIKAIVAGLPRLTLLNVSNNDIGDEGASATVLVSGSIVATPVLTVAMAALVAAATAAS